MTDQSLVSPVDPGPEDRSWWHVFRSWPAWARVPVYVAVGLVLVLVAGLVTGVALVRRPLPQTNGELDLPGLTSSVTVVRDEHGIPQIYGDSLEDLMRAQGFVHAQERFWEMDVRRHVTAGRLSELFGEDGLETDRFVRTMGWRRVAERELALIKPETRAALEAYADGVNAYVDSRSPSELAVEYTLLRAGGLDYHPEPWTAVDSLAWLKAMAWDLRGNMTDEIDRVLAAGGPHPGAGRAAVPRLPLRPERPHRRPGRGRRRRLRAGRHPRGDPAPAAAGVRRGARHAAPAAGRTRPAAGAARPRRGHRQQRVGGRRRALLDRCAAPGQRPSPRGHPPGRVDAGRAALP